jgi:capsular polysaccharide biosynthesis protein
MTQHTTIETNQLHIVSAFERAEQVIQGPLPIARLRNVRYQPSALERGQGLQIFEDGAIPREASYYDYVADFAREQLCRRGISSLPEPSAADEVADEMGDVCILANLFSRNFTHWHEELLKVVAIEAAELPCTYVLSGLPPFAHELLGLIGIPSQAILEVDRPLRFPSVLLPAAISYDNITNYPAVFHTLRERLLRAIDKQPSSECNRRLWLERGAQTRLGRGLINAEGVEHALERHGVDRVDLGALPMIQQLSLARDAQLMAGPHGSAFIHSQLMQACSTVVECFSPLYLNPTYTNIYRLQRHRYSLVVSTHSKLFPYPHGEDVCVDLPQLELALETAAHG